MRKAAAWLAIAGACALAGCGRSDTGVHVHAHLGALAYDELQFRVTVAGGDVVVDPLTDGRYQGPFQPGDQDVLIYLRDDLAGSQLHCEATALRAGAAVGAGAGDVTVVRGEMRDVEIFMADPGPGGAGAGGGGGGSGDGGGAGGGGGGGPGGGSGGPPGKSSGEACSVDGECLTGHCADGVCCESDCKMGCHSCALGDSPGLCRAVAAGAADPRGTCHDQGPASCKQTGLCAVDGTCAVYPVGTICGQSGCDPGGKMVLSAGACNGAGMCESPARIKCEDGATCVAGVCTEVQKLQP
ncbi:MAG TPA: hypothetical protein VIF57_28630 [Polyangia bacterium]